MKIEILLRNLIIETLIIIFDQQLCNEVSTYLHLVSSVTFNRR